MMMHIESCMQQVFPRLYLPVMAESYKRTLQPWRLYLPTRSWFEYRQNMTELDSYVKKRLRDRWYARQQGQRSSDDQDLADLLMSAIEVSSTRNLGPCGTRMHSARNCHSLAVQGLLSSFPPRDINGPGFPKMHERALAAYAQDILHATCQAIQC